MMINLTKLFKIEDVIIKQVAFSELPVPNYLSNFQMSNKILPKNSNNEAILEIIFYRRTPEQIKLAFGADDLTKIQDNKTIILNVSDIIIHPDFKP